MPTRLMGTVFHLLQLCFVATHHQTFTLNADDSDAASPDVNGTERWARAPPAGAKQRKEKAFKTI